MGCCRGLTITTYTLRSHIPNMIIASYNTYLRNASRRNQSSQAIRTIDFGTSFNDVSDIWTLWVLSLEQKVKVQPAA